MCKSSTQRKKEINMNDRVIPQGLNGMLAF